MTPPNYRYYAFISYSRKDEKLAKWLQDKLEAYRLPSVLQKQYESLPKVMKVFRDMTDITAGGRVEEALNRELQDSKKLIVICSPESAKSEWVELEVQNFLKLGHASDDIVTFVVDGEIKPGSPNNCYTPTLHDLNINAADINVYGKQDAFIRLLAGLLGIKYEDLRQREKERRIKKNIIIGFGAAAVLLVMFNIWDYFFHTKVRYYADYVERNGLPEGIFEITKDKEKMKNLAKRYRFENRQGKLRRVVHENSKGTPQEHNHTEFLNRPMIQEFEYEEKTKKLIKVFNKDINGKTLVLYDWPADLNYTRVNLRNEGKESQSMQSSLTTIDSSSTNAGTSPIRSIGYERDENGFAKKEHFYMYQGSRKAACDENGIYGFEYVRDEYGRVIEKWYLGNKGEKHADKNGVAGRIYEYENFTLVKTMYVNSDNEPVFNEQGWKICTAKIDEYGNVIKENFLDENGSLVVQENGTAEFKNEYKDGLLISQQYFDANSKPVLLNEGFSELRFEYDKNGREIKRSSFGIDGEPVFCNEGYASFGLFYNEKGNLIKRSFFGINGESVYCKEGFSTIVWTFDKNDNITEYKFYGLEDEPVYWKYGYFMQKCFYENGNFIKSEFFDIDGTTPIRCKDGYSICCNEYDDNGNCTQTAYFDIDGNPTVDTDNIHKIKREYNEESGQAERYSYFDINDKPVCSASDGYAGIFYTYDEGGNITSKKYFDVNGNPYFKEGYCEERYKYENGHIIEDTFHGKDGELVNNNSGFAIHKYVFDEKGDYIENYILNSDKKTVLSVGCAKEKFKYDNKGRQIEKSYFNLDGVTPVLITYGYASVLYEYDDYGRKTKETYCDTNGNKILLKDGYASVSYKYDRLGNIIEIEYFDENGKRTLSNKNCSKVKYEYDNYSNMTSVKFYGVTDEPVINNQNLFCIERQYDRFGQEIEISYFDTQYKPINVNGIAKIVKKYDSWGNVIRNTYYDMNNNLANRENGFADAIYVCDNRNKNIIRILYDVENDTITERNFDEMGNITKNKQYSKYEWKSDDDRKELYLYGNNNETHFKFDAYGQLLEKGLIYFIDNVRSYSKYNSNGKETDFMRYYENGNIKNHSKYNSNGKETDFIVYYENGNIEIHSKYNSDGKVKENLYYTEEGILEQRIEFYENGKKHFVTFYADDGHIEKIKEYDENGEVIALTEYDKQSEFDDGIENVPKDKNN